MLGRVRSPTRCHEAAEIGRYCFSLDTENVAPSMMSKAEARAQAYRDYAAQIRSVAAKCELPDAKAELENLARQLESLAPVRPIFSAKKRA